MNATLRIAILFSLAACGDDGNAESTPDAAISAECEEATTHSDLEWIQANVFARSCAFSSCHSGTASRAAGLALDSKQTSYDELVGKNSSEFPSYELVAPGSAATSYLMIAINGAEGPLPTSGRMPLSSPALCPQKVEAIARWINAGAPL